MSYPIISADSHVTEPADTYFDIEKKFRDRAPRLDVDTGFFYIDGMPGRVPMGIVAAAGKPWDKISLSSVAFHDLHRGGWDSKARLADQDVDGVAAEILYPSVGMVLSNHPDGEYKRACFKAYNRWLAAYCAPFPHRLIGIGQTAMTSPEEGIEDLLEIKALGLRGAMLVAWPDVEDYDSPIYDKFWDKAVELDLPISFHILPGKGKGFSIPEGRGPPLCQYLWTIRGNQEIIAMMVLSGLFDRNPNLKVVCVEADAGWMPHFSYRMDHSFKRHRGWSKAADLKKLPSEYLQEHFYLTFQDDLSAFQTIDLMNYKRLCWASDFPHSDSTWPLSQDVLREQTAGLTSVQREAILSGNVADLYKIDVRQLGRMPVSV